MLWADTQNLPYLILQNKTMTLWMTQDQASMEQGENNKNISGRRIDV